MKMARQIDQRQYLRLQRKVEMQSGDWYWRVDYSTYPIVHREIMSPLQSVYAAIVLKDRGSNL